LGGIDFFLGGIGHDGHIAFNFQGCDPLAPTRLVTLNYQTAAQSASSFGGIQHTRNKCAVTIGLSTITHKK
jgi:glucosamine-6-phosphate deaminase